MRNLCRVAKCLEDASLCIGRLPADYRLVALHPQLLSLKLILDNNAAALRSRIVDLRKLTKTSLNKEATAKP